MRYKFIQLIQEDLIRIQRRKQIVGILRKRNTTRSELEYLDAISSIIGRGTSKTGAISSQIPDNLEGTLNIPTDDEEENRENVTYVCCPEYKIFCSCIKILCMDFAKRVQIAYYP